MQVLVARNSSNAEANDASMLLSAYFSSQGIGCALADSHDLSARAADEADLVVSLGGDGTILRAAQAVRCSGVPILGINFGHLGFLANANDAGVVNTVAAALAGEVAREERANLRIDVLCEGDDAQSFDAMCVADADFSASRTFFALNELAVLRGDSGHIVNLDVSIAGAHVAGFRADGFLVATATGSTAYALAEGGPLVAPGFQGLIALPIAPHTLKSRPILTNASDVVDVAVADDRASRETTLLVDGGRLDFDTPIQRVVVRRGAAPTVLLRYRHEGFYEHAAKVFF